VPAKGDIYRILIDAMADGMVFVRDGSDEVIINDAAKRLLSIPENTDVDRTYLKDVVGFYPFELLTGFETQAPVREELSIGDRRLHSLVTPVGDGTDYLGVVAVLRDFTELAALVTDRDEVLGNLSNKLRAPLTSIAGALDLALGDSSTTRVRRYIELAHDSCSKLGTVIDDFMDVAKAESGAMPLMFAPLFLDELTTDVVERFSSAAAAKNVTIGVSAAEPRTQVAGDAERLTQVLSNLLANAVKFTPEGGEISVELFGPSIASSHVGVSVFNQGEPIGEADRERVFGTARGGAHFLGGSALGLAVSRFIIEGHGGRMWVE